MALEGELELQVTQRRKEAEAEVIQWGEQVEADASTRAAHLNDLRLLIYARAFLDEIVKRGYLREFEELLLKREEQRLP